ncbi:MAG: hypothetical protein JJ920_08185 [Roseitalea sp.]|jgi:hypothetical protein|nr:hypothetical protein [Roseitalea sp.]MBO6721052.1 hypothetical protein [Roseitalea sp.]MBO6742876.1 hypothetical protein [Roseitalea sp.]
MFISAILSALGLGVLVYLLFTLAVYALPFFVAVTVGMYVHDTDAGLIAAFVSAFFAGAITLIASQIAFATIRSVPVRLAIGALYAAPAGIAGYHAIKGLSEIGGAGETWTLVFAWIGAIVVGATAWARIASLSGPDDKPAGVASHLSTNCAANDG